jgi:hypothetical protein
MGTKNLNLKFMIRFFVALFVAFSFGNCGEHYDKVFQLNPDGYDLINQPVFVDIEKEIIGDLAVVCLSSKGKRVPAQLESISETHYRLWWMVNLMDGESASYGLQLGKKCKVDEAFSWERLTDHAVKLNFGQQAVIQYEHPVYDSNNIEDTKKPYHHVFDPSGTSLITKGLGGLYPHHRGIFFGYNHVYTGEERVDIWHAHNGERSEHESILAAFAGPVMGGHILQILWKDTKGQPFIEETREIRVFKQAAGESLIDFKTSLRAINEPIRLEGDLQHAGVQFRAAQYVADNPDKTTFIRPPAWSTIDPASELKGEDIYDLPWNAMHFSIEGKPFTVTYMSHPSNALSKEMSERLYGRFGEFFPLLVSPGKPVTLHYRFWIKAGEPPGIDDIEKRYQALVSLPLPIIKK